MINNGKFLVGRAVFERCYWEKVAKLKGWEERDYISLQHVALRDWLGLGLGSLPWRPMKWKRMWI